MEIKDWIQILVEIICNGVILVIFGKWLDIKMKRIERKEKTRVDIVNLFFEELAKLNKVLVSVSCTVKFKKIINIDEVMELIEKNVLKQWIEIITFYDTYNYDLQEFETYYNKMNVAWEVFVHQTTLEMMGQKLQEFKEANQEMIAEIRKKY